MKRTVIIFSVLALLISCTKPIEYNRMLGLFSIYNNLSNEGGSTQVPVYSNTDWTVKFQEPVSWASIDRLGGHLSGHVVFDYEVNYGRSRRVILEFAAGGETMTLNMFQKAGIADSDVQLSIGASSFKAPASGCDTTIAFKTNLVYNLDELYLDITYPEGQESEEPWITLANASKDSLWLDFAPVDTVGTRVANVRIAHTDAGKTYNSEVGETLRSNILTVIQKRDAE